jgi:hypothetical protein
MREPQSPQDSPHGRISRMVPPFPAGREFSVRLSSFLRIDSTRIILFPACLCKKAKGFSNCGLAGNCGGNKAALVEKTIYQRLSGHFLAQASSFDFYWKKARNAVNPAEDTRIGILYLFLLTPQKSGEIRGLGRIRLK